jgi:CSLREA domain-containing protein
MLLTSLTVWFAAPRLFRHWVEPTVFAASMTFVVNTTADSDDGACTSVANGCTLREAIKAANLNLGIDTINFNIPGAGLQTVHLTSELPDVKSPVIIDGYSQAGASANSLSVGDNAVLLVELEGSIVSNLQPLSSSGLFIGSGGGGSTVKGLVINRFSSTGIFMSSAADTNVIQGNFIGTNATGDSVFLGLSGLGISVGSANNTIGGTTPAARNVISGHFRGVAMFSGATGNQVQNNYIGTDRSGNQPLGNKLAGVEVFAGSNNTIGGTLPTSGNLIAFNERGGIELDQSATATAIQGNSVHSNFALGIDLEPSGVTANDPGDADMGANNLQNFPVLTQAIDAAGVTTVLGTLNSTPNTQFRIEFFSSPSCDDSGNGEGKKFLGFELVTTDASGNASLGLSVASASLDGLNLTATATDPGNNTSEFSNCVVADSFIFTVNSTADTDDGSCTSAAGGCTLREAINAANLTPEANAIKFDIPGSGLHTISPQSALPIVTSPVLIDGYTQPGSIPNTLTTGDNAVLLIELSGASAGGAEGIFLKGGNSVVRGLVINGFQLNGIKVDTEGDNVIAGNFIGTNAAGDTAVGNNQAGVSIAMGSHSNSIGGTAPSARNLLSGNATRGISIAFSSNNRVVGNYIGTDASGNVDLGNSLDGVTIGGSSNFNLIGGAIDGARNVISGNQGSGVQIVAGPPGGNRVQGNFIGTKANGIDPLGNVIGGIDMNSVNTTVGGNGFLGDGNTITFNGAGVFVGSGTGNRILGNSIHSNEGNPGLGIDLFPNGLTANDAGDSDSGANNLQNFPVLTEATKIGNSTNIVASLNSTPNTTFYIEFFSNPSCDPSGNGEGHNLVNATHVTTDNSGNVVFGLNLSNSSISGPFITATATDPTGNTSEFSPCFEAPPTSNFQFGTPNVSIVEDCDEVIFTVSRVGDTTFPASVDYASQSGTASDRTDFTTAVGTLHFSPGETAMSFSVLVAEDSFVEGTETATLTLSNAVGAGLGSSATATLQITDDQPEQSNNPVDVAEQFVCQHYQDFLNREHDVAGLNFWTNEIESCGADAECRAVKRINVSAAFFLSIEFQETGGDVIRTQRAAFGKKSDTAASRLTYLQFLRDARQVGNGVIVNEPGWQQTLEDNKQTYAEQVVTSSQFVAQYPLNQNADTYVDALFASAGVAPTASERQEAINAFGAGGTAGRTAALRKVADSQTLRAAEFRPAFVLMQYFGYLRRNPTDPPDSNDNGYQFWLTKLNAFNGDFVTAEMVKAFIVSTEYRSRFGAP